MEQLDSEAFHQWGEETQQRYLKDTKPILAPFAEHYEEVQKQMDIREKIYQRQISK